jgi:hypothetical protein
MSFICCFCSVFTGAGAAGVIGLTVFAEAYLSLVAYFGVVGACFGGCTTYAKKRMAKFYGVSVEENPTGAIPEPAVAGVVVAPEQETMGSKCVQCGAGIGPTDRFCNKCGAKQDQPEDGGPINNF